MMRIGRVRSRIGDSAEGGTRIPHRPRCTGRRVHGAVAQRMGMAILSGDHPAGVTLPGEIEMSRTLDVSRGAYREAVRVLIAKGLVESLPGIGTRVLPRTRWHLLDPDVLSWAFANAPETAFGRELLEMRAIVAPAAAALAAERRGPSHLRIMRAALVTMRHHPPAAQIARAADRDFHDAVLLATRNEALVALSAGIGAAIDWGTRFGRHEPSTPGDPVLGHDLVYDAIAAGDADGASAAMRTLVDRRAADG